MIGPRIALVCFVCSAVSSVLADEVWGENRGVMRVTATRHGTLEGRARPIEPVSDKQPLRLSFRFRSVGGHSYGALLFVGVRGSGGDFKTHAAGLILHRHGPAHGFLATATVADPEGVLHRGKPVRLAYDEVYDVTCIYAPEARQLRLAVRAMGDGKLIGESVLTVPPEVSWRADQLAVWNYADGQPKVVNSSRLTVFIDQLKLADLGPFTFDKGVEDMPLHMGDGDAVWVQAPQEPIFRQMTAPRDCSAGQDCRVEVTVRSGLAGPVEFALKTYAGDELAKQTAPLRDGTATVTFPATVLDALPREELVALAQVVGKEEVCGRAVVLHGRVFRNVTREPEGMLAGDEIILDGMSRFGPAKAIADSSRKGMWWRRRYQIGDTSRDLLCVEEHDRADPESCLAPPISLPLSLTGWYEVWVRTYRPAAGGGIDVRLSDEPYFHHLDPQEVRSAPGDKAPRLVDMRFRACDLTGRALEFQQPFGTFESENKLCNAAIAGLRLVKLSPVQVARLQAEFADPANRVTGFDNDGYSYFWKWGRHDPAIIARLLEPLRTPSAAFLNVSLGGVGGLSIPTPYTDLFQLRGHVRDGDFRANEFFRWCAANDVNLVNVLAKRAHELNLKLFVATMMERSYSPDSHMKSHPDWRVTRGRGTWDYAKPEVRAYQVRKIAWICANHEIDGFIVDFTRYGHFFNEDEPDKFAHMNTFVRDLRRAIDQVNAKKERPVALCASFGDECWFLRNWGTGKLDEQGLDIDTWLEEGVFDILMPEGKTCLDYVKQAVGSRTKVWPRKVSGVTLATDEKVGALSPKEIEQQVGEAFKAGAPGIFFFNHTPWNTLGRLGVRGELPLRAATETAYGVRLGDQVVFAEWLPSLQAKHKQVGALPPVSVPCVAGKADTTFAFTLRNTFDHPVTARVRWQVGEVTVEPTTATHELAPGATCEAAQRIAGPATAKLAADIVFDAGGITVFRHRMPIRLVPEMTAETAQHVGAESTVTVSRDEQNLTVVFAVPFAPPEHAEPVPTESWRALGKRPRVQVDLDVGADERATFRFVADAHGSRYESHSAFDSFLGKHRHNPGWDGTWERRIEATPTGCEITLMIPLATLGKGVGARSFWRARFAVHIPAAGSSHWPPERSDSPADFGRLVFR